MTDFGSSVDLLRRSHEMYGAGSQAMVDPSRSAADLRALADRLAATPALAGIPPEQVRARVERLRQLAEKDVALARVLQEVSSSHAQGRSATGTVLDAARRDGVPAGDTPVGVREFHRRMASRMSDQRGHVLRSTGSMRSSRARIRQISYRGRRSRRPARGGGRFAMVGGGGPKVFKNLDKHQMWVASEIINEAKRRRLPKWAAVLGVACAMQESNLRVLANKGVADSMGLPHVGIGGDHDSVGPFQQRQSWGATADLMNPATSAGKFYDQLVAVRGWMNKSLTRAIQQVQRSAFPDAYARHEGAALSVVNSLWAA